jgi:hypothetical protein
MPPLVLSEADLSARRTARPFELDVKQPHAVLPLTAGRWLLVSRASRAQCFVARVSSGLASGSGAAGSGSGSGSGSLEVKGKPAVVSVTASMLASLPASDIQFVDL